MGGIARIWRIQSHEVMRGVQTLTPLWPETQHGMTRQKRDAGMAGCSGSGLSGSEQSSGGTSAHPCARAFEIWPAVPHSALEA